MHMTAHCHNSIEALPGVLGNRGKRGTFISGEQRPDFEENKGTKTILGLEEQGNKPIYFRGTRKR